MFEIPPQQFHQLRKNALAKALVASFADTPQQAAIDPRSGDVIATDPHGHSLRFGFDEQGFVGSVTSPLGRVWRFDNGPQGRLQALTSPAGLNIRLDYDISGRPAALARDGRAHVGLGYDEIGNLSRIDHPDGSATALAYHAPGQLAEKTGRLGHKEHYRYNETGQLVAITNANGQTTEFEYGGWDRPDRAIFPDGREENYAYDEQGRVRQIVVKNGYAAILDYEGDSLYPACIAYDDGEILEFVRDSQGRVLEAKNAEATAKYQYDDQGRVVREEVNGAVVQYQYDEVGSLVKLAYPGGDSVRFGYDADLRLDQVKDWNGGVCYWGYGEDDRTQAIAYPSGLQANFWQTPAGRIEAIDLLNRAGDHLFGSRYDYDEEDRLQQSEDTRSGVRRYQYDAESRLLAVEADEAGLSEHFAYDPNGNRTECNGETAEFDAADRLLQQGRIYCEYDAQGRLVLQQSPGGEWRYQWNSRGQLIRAESSGGRVVTFGYDAFGRRLWKRSRHRGQETETRFYWAGEHLIGEETWSGGQAVRRQDYLYQPGSYTPLATRIDGKVYHYHCDPLGTPRRLTDNTGQVVWEADYNAFGQAQLCVEEISNPLRFPGQYCDAETGMHYNRFRYYSADLGRYLSSDPLSYLEGMNLYSYSGSNPINRIDALGLFSLTGFIKAAIPVVAAIAVGIAVVALAPIALPLAIIAGGIAAGAVYGGLNEAINGTFCFECIAKAALRGGIVGGLAAIPFALLPVTAGIAAFAGAGGISGGIGYTGDWIANGANLSNWSWKGFGTAVGIGAVTAGAGKYISGRIATKINGLDWTRISGRTGSNAAEHVTLNHGTLSLTKPTQGVFYGNPVSTVEDAWAIANQNGLEPVTSGNRDIYVVPRPNSGYAGGMGGQLENYNNVTIITESGTNRVVTAYPSGGTPPLPKGYNFLLGNN